MTLRPIDTGPTWPVLCSKCKLYRFDKEGSSAGEWKERGVGQVHFVRMRRVVHFTCTRHIVYHLMCEAGRESLTAEPHVRPLEEIWSLFTPVMHAVRTQDVAIQACACEALRALPARASTTCTGHLVSTIHNGTATILLLSQTAVQLPGGTSCHQCTHAIPGARGMVPVRR